LNNRFKSALVLDDTGQAGNETRQRGCQQDIVIGIAAEFPAQWRWFDMQGFCSKPGQRAGGLGICEEFLSHLGSDGGVFFHDGGIDHRLELSPC